MSKPEPVETAQALVAERFPSARQAWLAGSVTRGEATETSDLDIPVLLDDADPHRETLTYRDWLVEVFVHTEESIRRFLARDVARRRPTLARMISAGVPLLSPDAGIEIRRECADLLARGPAPVTDLELAHARYALTDQLDDLVGGAVPPVLDAIIIDVWQGCLELILARPGCAMTSVVGELGGRGHPRSKGQRGVPGQYRNPDGRQRDRRGPAP